MKTALIGHTGFVGSNLLRQHSFTKTFNSANIGEIAEEEFDLVVSAAPSAVKWKANKFPEEDKKLVDSFVADLSKVKTKRFICVSTCDVYKVPREVDESYDPHQDISDLHPYGKHRLQLEDFVRENFADSLVVRLPALFGEGLKKNVIYDFMHNNMLEAIHADGSFQFYNLKNIWSDFTKAQEAEIKLLNITTEPVTVREIAKKCFGLDFNNQTDAVPASYDLRSRYDSLWRGEDGYLYDKETVLTDISEFVKNK